MKNPLTNCVLSAIECDLRVPSSKALASPFERADMLLTFWSFLLRRALCILGKFFSREFKMVCNGSELDWVAILLACNALMGLLVSKRATQTGLNAAAVLQARSFANCSSGRFDLSIL